MPRASVYASIGFRSSLHVVSVYVVRELGLYNLYSVRA
jgi:hypothetical protein